MGVVNILVIWISSSYLLKSKTMQYHSQAIQWKWCQDFRGWRFAFEFFLGITDNKGLTQTHWSQWKAFCWLGWTLDEVPSGDLSLKRCILKSLFQQVSLNFCIVYVSLISCQYMMYTDYVSLLQLQSELFSLNISKGDSLFRSKAWDTVSKDSYEV